MGKMANKKEIDTFFNKNYEKLLSDTIGWVNYCDEANASAEDYISESYIYAIKNMEKFGGEEIDIKNYVYRFIIDNVRWTNSAVNRTAGNQIKNKKNIYVEYNDEICGEIESDDFFSIEEENEKNLRLASIEIYNQGASKEDKIVLDVFINKNKRTVRTLAKHLNIKHTQSWVKICEMKSEIKKIYEMLKNKQ